MRFRNVNVMMLLFSCFLFTYNIIGCQYWIRDARMDDKQRIIDLYKKSNSFCAELPSPPSAVSHMITDVLYSSVIEGFAFVVEGMSKENQGQILAFLLKHRSLQLRCNHILDGGFMVIDTHYRDEMLGMQLCQHLLRLIEEYHPDILRVEANCSEIAVESIDLYERCGFFCEGRRERSVRIAGRRLVDDFVFVWWNKYFDINFCGYGED